MQYLGGKAQIRKDVCATVARFRSTDQVVWEPFCGGLNSAVGHKGLVICSDASRSLIALLQAVRLGWDPPSVVSRETWETSKTLPETNPMHGFCKFGCALRGIPGTFSDVSSTKPLKTGAFQPAATTARNALLRDARKPSAIFWADFLAIEPRRLSAVIYCDPPYRGRTGYDFDFDHDLFVERVKEWSRFAHAVLVSEYDFPIGEIVWERLRGGKTSEGSRLERIYRIR
jgi:site-specific DNA-adenine methylase